MLIVIVCICLLLLSSSAGAAWWYFTRSYVPKGCVGWWDASSWTAEVWKDKSAAKRDAQILGSTAKVGDAIEGGAGASVKFIDFTNNPMPNITVVHVTKYREGATALGRIFTDYAGFNWISGQHGARSQVAWHGMGCNKGTAHSDPAAHDKFSWLISVDRRNSTSGWTYRAQGRDLCGDMGPAPTGGYGINGWPTELSEWSVRELLIFNRELTTSEIVKLESALKKKYNITTPSSS